MRIVIHRGSHEIGGSCIEFESGRTRLIFDAGLPLKPSEARSDQPDVSGLWNGTSARGVDALFLSHAHPDHSGLIWATRHDIPVHLSKGTSKMLLAGSIFAGQRAFDRLRQECFETGENIDVGPFRVTPLAVDHSVFDAHAFLIEAEGKRLIYTGDLRFHGRKPGMARKLVQAARDVDVLVIEGTRLGARAEEPNLSERQLEQQLVTDIQAAPGCVLALYSPLNLDRFVSFFRAALRCGRTMVVDPYQAFVLHLVARRSLPKPGPSSGLRMIVPPDFVTKRAHLAAKPWFAQALRGEISAAEIARAPGQFVVLFRESLAEAVFPEGYPRNLTCIYSYWAGYLSESRMRALRVKMSRPGRSLLVRHASGHAHWRDLTKFVQQVRPILLVPVHTESPDAWRDHWKSVRVAEDGVAMEF